MKKQVLDLEPQLSCPKKKSEFLKSYFFFEKSRQKVSKKLGNQLITFFIYFGDFLTQLSCPRKIRIFKKLIFLFFVGKKPERN